MCCTRLAEIQDAKKSPKIAIFAPSHNFVGLYLRKLRYVSSIGNKPAKQQYVLQMSPQYGELRPTSGWDRFVTLGHLTTFQLVSRLGSVTARHVVVGVSHTLRRWIDGATYVWQGDHQVGHWPTFLVLNKQSPGLLRPSMTSKNDRITFSYLLSALYKAVRYNRKTAIWDRPPVGRPNW